MIGYIHGQTRWYVELAFHLEDGREIFRGDETNAPTLELAVAEIHHRFKDDISNYYGSRVIASSVDRVTNLGPAYIDYGPVDVSWWEL